MFLPSLPISSERNNLPFIHSSQKQLLCLFMILLCLFHSIKENAIHLIHSIKPVHFATSLHNKQQDIEKLFLKMQRIQLNSIQINSIQYSWSGSSSLQSLNNLCKRRSCFWIRIPAIPNQHRIPFWTCLWNRQSLLMRMHHHRDLSLTLLR